MKNVDEKDKNLIPLRVLHVFAQLNRGGAETMVMNLYRKINRQHVQFDFVVHSDSVGEYEAEITELGGRIYRLDRYNGLNHFRYLSQWHQLLGQHPEIKIIHGHIRSTAIFYLSIAKQFGMVTISHSHSTSSGGGFSGRVKDILQIGIRYVADYFVACSLNAGEWLFGKKVCSNTKFSILRNGIDIDRFVFSADKSKATKKELNISEQSFVIGHIGRFIPLKNHLFIVGIFEQILIKNPNSILLLVGDGELLETVKQEVTDRGLENKVILTGSRSDIPELLMAMDAFVLPSQYEGLPVTLVEAQATGLPCLVSDVVSKEVILTDLIHFQSLKISAEIWANNLLRIAELNQRSDRREDIARSGYDVEVNARWLTQYYQDISKKNC